MFTTAKKVDFSFILNKGTKIVGNTHVLFSVQSDDCNKRLMGIIVSKKLGNAIKRNRIKRRLRAVIPTIFSDSTCRNYVIIGRKKALFYPFNLLINDFKDSLRKLNNLS